MKRVNSRKIATSLAILGVAAMLTGCGSPQNIFPPPNAIAGGGIQNQCLVNLLPTSTGSMVSPMINDVWINVSLASAGFQPGGYIVAGSLPGGFSQGQITVSPGTAMTAATYVRDQVSDPDAAIYLNMPANTITNSTPSAQQIVSGNGAIRVKQSWTNRFLAEYGLPGNGVEVCVNGMAMNLDLTAFNNNILTGRIYPIINIIVTNANYFPGANATAITAEFQQMLQSNPPYWQF